MTPYEETMNAIREFKKRENKLKIQKKRIELELERIQYEKMILAIIISGDDPKYVEELIKDGTRTTKREN